jgi:hypothetical protein
MRESYGRALAVILTSCSCRVPSSPDASSPPHDSGSFADSGSHRVDGGPDGGTCDWESFSTCVRVLRPVRGAASSVAWVSAGESMWGQGMGDAGPFRFSSTPTGLSHERHDSEQRFTAASSNGNLCGTQLVGGVSRLWRRVGGAEEILTNRPTGRCVAIVDSGSSLVSSLSTQSRDFIWLASGEVVELRLPSDEVTGRPVYYVQGFSNEGTVVGHSAWSKSVLGRDNGVFVYSVSDETLRWLYSTDAALSVRGVTGAGDALGQLSLAPAIWSTDGGTDVWGRGPFAAVSLLDSFGSLALGEAVTSDRRTTLVLLENGNVIQIPFATILGAEPWTVSAAGGLLGDGTVALNVTFGDPFMGFSYEAVLLLVSPRRQ